MRKSLFTSSPLHLFTLSLFLLFVSCSETDSDSYPPTWLGFTYTTGSFSNYVQGGTGNVTLFLGDSIHLTACQNEHGRLINSTDYTWTVCYDTLDTKGNDDPNDDVIVHVQKEYNQHTNYDGYTNGADDPVGHLLIPANALPTTTGRDTIKFVARYVFSGGGIIYDNGNIVDNTSYNGRITSQSGPTGGGAVGYFYFYVSDHKAVDLALPSGTLWATCNIGANGPEEYGNYYAWGETTHHGKTAYDWSSYKFAEGSYSSITKYCTDTGYGTVDNKEQLDPSDDVARQSWGAEWRMPTGEQFAELMNENNTTTLWLTTQNGTSGLLVISKRNAARIFLPAAGTRDGTNLFSKGDVGEYWTQTLGSATPDGRRLRFDPTSTGMGDKSRNCGLTVRPVRNYH